MAVTKFLARDLDIHINTGTIAAPVWTAIGGINTLTHSPSSSDADTTDFDSMGREEHLKASRSDAWSLSGFHLEDVTTGVRDVGQTAVETLGQALGLTSLGQFRVTSPGGNTIKFMASAEVTKHSGGNNDAASWQVALKVSGAVTYA